METYRGGCVAASSILAGATTSSYLNSNQNQISNLNVNSGVTNDEISPQLLFGEGVSTDDGKDIVIEKDNIAKTIVICGEAAGTYANLICTDGTNVLHMVSEIDGYTITDIQSGAFIDTYDAFETIDLSDTQINSVEATAFKNFGNVSTIKLPSTLRIAGHYAFGESFANLNGENCTLALNFTDTDLAEIDPTYFSNNWVSEGYENLSDTIAVAIPSGMYDAYYNDYSSQLVDINLNNLVDPAKIVSFDASYFFNNNGNTVNGSVGTKIDAVERTITITPNEDDSPCNLSVGMPDEPVQMNDSIDLGEVYGSNYHITYIENNSIYDQNSNISQLDLSTATHLQGIETDAFIGFGYTYILRLPASLNKIGTSAFCDIFSCVGEMGETACLYLAWGENEIQTIQAENEWVCQNFDTILSEGLQIYIPDSTLDVYQTYAGEYLHFSEDALNALVDPAVATTLESFDAGTFFDSTYGTVYGYVDDKTHTITLAPYVDEWGNKEPGIIRSESEEDSPTLWMYDMVDIGRGESYAVSTIWTNALSIQGFFGTIDFSNNNNLKQIQSEAIVEAGDVNTIKLSSSIEEIGQYAFTDAYSSGRKGKLYLNWTRDDIGDGKLPADNMVNTIKYGALADQWVCYNYNSYSSKITAYVPKDQSSTYIDFASYFKLEDATIKEDGGGGGVGDILTASADKFFDTKSGLKAGGNVCYQMDSNGNYVIVATNADESISTNSVSGKDLILKDKVDPQGDGNVGYIVSIERQSFYDDLSISGSLEFADPYLWYIQAFAFAGCDNITSVDLSQAESLNIGDGAFFLDKQLTDVSLPSNTSFEPLDGWKIDSDMWEFVVREHINAYINFGACPLKNINFNPSLTSLITEYDSKNGKAYYIDPLDMSCYDEDENYEWIPQQPAILPDLNNLYRSHQVNNLGANHKWENDDVVAGSLACGEIDLSGLNMRTMLTTFLACAGITKITLPSTVTLLGIAFAGCENLETFNFENLNRLGLIGPGCFFDCPSLKNANLKNCKSLWMIAPYAFTGCPNLNAIWMPDENPVWMQSLWEIEYPDKKTEQWVTITLDGLGAQWMDTPDFSKWMQPEMYQMIKPLLDIMDLHDTKINTIYLPSSYYKEYEIRIMDSDWYQPTTNLRQYNVISVDLIIELALGLGLGIPLVCVSIGFIVYANKHRKSAYALKKQKK